MARHIWESRRLMKSTTDLGILAIVIAHKNGLDFEAACKFGGYYMERCRQGGHEPVWPFWDACVRSNHRYARGQHANNHLKAGMLILTEYARNEAGVGLDDPEYESVPANLVLDRIIEENLIQVPTRKDNYVIKVSNHEKGYYDRYYRRRWSRYRDGHDLKEKPCTKECATRFTLKEARDVVQEFIDQTGTKVKIEKAD